MTRVPFKTPKLSATAEAVKVVHWLKQPGDVVREGESFVELETDKTVLEIESPIDGTLYKIHAAEGEGINAGELLAEFDASFDGVQTPPKMLRPIIKKNLMITPVALTAMRQSVAETVSVSRREIPSYWVERWICTDRFHLIRKQYSEKGIRLSITDYLIKAIAYGLAQSTIIRTRWIQSQGNAPYLEQLESPGIGLVVALEEGMLVPVLAVSDLTPIEEIRLAREVAVNAARTGHYSEICSLASTVSLSNLGSMGVDRFEAIVLPGQTAIVAVGRETIRVQLTDAGFSQSKGVNVIVSVDHRVVDGVAAGRFISHIADWMETDANSAY